MRELGRVIRLQVQRSSLKTGENPSRVYDPAPLLPVECLTLSPDGVLGAAPDRSWIVDIHHRAHPQTKNADGEHGVSVGFTSHYAVMRERFGDRIQIGCAGENIIVDSEQRLTFDELRAGLAIRSPDGAERARLTVLDIARPCRPFTGWALGGRVEAEVLKSHLQFLDGGTRGFYCVGVGTGIVSLGDRMVVL